MFVLDTNVLSEIMNPDGAAIVLSWADPIRRSDLFTTAVNQAEILYGLAVMPDGRKRDRLIVAADAMFAEDFRGRILPFDERAAAHYAEISATCRRIGMLGDAFDIQIAAISRANDMTVVTRNVRHFENCGVDILDPWKA